MDLEFLRGIEGGPISAMGGQACLYLYLWWETRHRGGGGDCSTRPLGYRVCVEINTVQWRSHLCCEFDITIYGRGSIILLFTQVYKQL